MAGWVLASISKQIIGFSRIFKFPKIFSLRNIHKENVPSNKTHALTKSMSTGISTPHALNKLFILSSNTEIKF